MNLMKTFSNNYSRYWVFFVLLGCSNTPSIEEKTRPSKTHPNGHDRPKIGNLIKYNGVQNLILGDSIAKIWTLFPTQNIKFYEDFGYVIAQGDTIELLVSCKDQIHIATLEFYSSNFKTESGVFPGMPINEVQERYPDFYLQVNQIDLNEEMFCPAELRMKRNEVEYLTCINFLNEGNDDFIGNYPSGEPESKATKFRKKTLVNNIRVFLPGDGSKFKK